MTPSAPSGAKRSPSMRGEVASIRTGVMRTSGATSEASESRNARTKKKIRDHVERSCEQEQRPEAGEDQSGEGFEGMERQGAAFIARCL
jgi:hypothetical protein